MQLVKTLRLLRIFKLLKVINFAQLSNILEDNFNISAATFHLLDMLFRIVFACHLVACAWWGLTAAAMVGPHWFNYVPNTFSKLEEATFQDQYVAALYWTVQTLTTTGWGDVGAVSDNERILAIVILVFGATFFSYIVAHISDLLSSFNQSEARVAHRMTEIKEFLRYIQKIYITSLNSNGMTDIKEFPWSIQGA